MADFALRALAPDSLKFAFFQELVLSSVRKHRRELKSQDWADAPILTVHGIQEVDNPRLLRGFLLRC